MPYAVQTLLLGIGVGALFAGFVGRAIGWSAGYSEGFDTAKRLMSARSGVFTEADAAEARARVAKADFTR